MENFKNLKIKVEKGVRKAALVGALAATSLGAVPIKTHGETSPVSDKDKVEKLVKDTKEELSTKNKEIIDELFSQREIHPNQGEEFLKKVDFWYKKHSEGGANNQSLKDGWKRLLDTNKKKQSDLETVFEIFQKHGLPNDLIFLALAESYWTNATSPKGASGPWQFMPGTADRFGLKNRSNIAESTEAACKYLKDLYKMAQECARAAGVPLSESDAWAWAFLAYNRGEGAVLWTPKKHIKGDFFKYNGDINEYIKNCKIKESVNYPTKVLGIAKALENMNMQRGEVAVK